LRFCVFGFVLSVSPDSAVVTTPRNFLSHQKIIPCDQQFDLCFPPVWVAAMIGGLVPEAVTIAQSQTPSAGSEDK